MTISGATDKVIALVPLAAATGLLRRATRGTKRVVKKVKARKPTRKRSKRKRVVKKRTRRR